MTFVEGKYFRVNTITRIKKKISAEDIENNNLCEELTIKDGLAIEQRCKDKEHYFVVAFVKPYIKKHNSLNSPTIEFASVVDGVELIDVEFRTVDMINEDMSIENFWEMMQEYMNCVEFAKNAVEDSLGYEN